MYVPVKKAVIDLTTSDPTADILAVTFWQEFNDGPMDGLFAGGSLTFSRGGSLNVYIFSRMSRTDPIFLPPIVVDDGTPAAQPSTGEISAA